MKLNHPYECIALVFARLSLPAPGPISLGIAPVACTILSKLLLLLLLLLLALRSYPSHALYLCNSTASPTKHPSRYLNTLPYTARLSLALQGQSASLLQWGLHDSDDVMQAGPSEPLWVASSRKLERLRSPITTGKKRKSTVHRHSPHSSLQSVVSHARLPSLRFWSVILLVLVALCELSVR